MLEYRPTLSKQLPNTLPPSTAINHFTEGDLHSNVVRRLESLLHFGVITIDSQDYSELVKLYVEQSIVSKGQTPEKIEELIKNTKDKIGKIRIKNPGIICRSLEDWWADRTGNMLFNVYLEKHLKKIGVKTTRLAANHDIPVYIDVLNSKNFDEFQIIVLKNKFYTDALRQGAAIINYIMTIRSLNSSSHHEHFLELRGVIKDALLELKLIDYYVERDTLHIVTHGVPNAKDLTELAEQFDIECDFSKATSQEIINCIDQINTRFHVLVNTSSSSGAFLENIFAQGMPAFNLCWKREKGDYLPARINGGNIIHIHGHDKTDGKRPSHIISLDNEIGKGAFENYSRTTQITAIGGDASKLSLELTDSFNPMDVSWLEKELKKEASRLHEIIETRENREEHKAIVPLRVIGCEGMGFPDFAESVRELWNKHYCNKNHSNEYRRLYIPFFQMYRIYNDTSYAVHINRVHKLSKMLFGKVDMSFVAALASSTRVSFDFLCYADKLRSELDVDAIIFKIKSLINDFSPTLVECFKFHVAQSDKTIILDETVLQIAHGTVISRMYEMEKYFSSLQKKPTPEKENSSKVLDTDSSLLGCSATDQRQATASTKPILDDVIQASADTTPNGYETDPEALDYLNDLTEKFRDANGIISKPESGDWSRISSNQRGLFVHNGLFEPKDKRAFPYFLDSALGKERVLRDRKGRLLVQLTRRVVDLAEDTPQITETINKSY